MWDGQQGGIEGLNQDTWVVAYIAELKTALSKFKLRYHLLVKGDDARVIMIIPPEYLKGSNITLGDLKTSIVTEVSVVLGQFGQKDNIQESYGSEHFFAFSKDNVRWPIGRMLSFGTIQTRTVSNFIAFDTAPHGGRGGIRGKINCSKFIKNNNILF